MDESMDDTAKCFVPEMLVEYIHKNIRLGRDALEPTSFYINGVCLLVDISGFTKLSGDFCAQGKSGIDELQLVTNGYMGKLVEIIYTFGGEIIKFAGDAIICVFSAAFATQLSSKPTDKGGKLRRSMGTFSNHIIREESMTYNLSRATTSNSGVNGMVPSPIVTKDVSIVPPSVILRAMHCAQVLKAVQTEKLSVHVGMSCGEMCFGILGGFENRWECLISGPCIHQLSDCLDDAPSKEAVITCDCADIILQYAKFLPKQDEEESIPFSRFTVQTENSNYNCCLHLLESGNYRIVSINNSISTHPSVSVIPQVYPHNAAMDSLIRQFVPVPIAEELESAAGLTYLAEIREVTTMFMKWDSYDAKGRHRDLLELQNCFFEAQKILQNSGAYLRQFLVDDKGCVLIGCWGMPHLSYLDNTHRALSAAAQIKYELNKREMSCSFGITTGDVYCGTVGSALRMEYAAIGSVVNMAARLMCKALGGILIDDATYTRLPSSVLEHLLKLEPIKVKGRDEPLQVYSYNSTNTIQVKEKVVEDHEITADCKEKLLRLIDTLTSSSCVPPISPKKARQGSMASIRQWMSGQNVNGQNANSTGSQRILQRFISSSMIFMPSSAPLLPLVVLSGKEGSGRTTVVRWLNKRVQDHNIAVLHIKSARKDASVPFSVWRKLFQMLTSKGPESQIVKILSLLEEVYGGAQPQMQAAFAVLKMALGVTCCITEVESDVSKGQWLSRKLSPSAKPPTASQITDTLTRIFSHVLCTQTRLVVVENIDLVDEDSLKLLAEVVKINAPSAIVLTSLDSSSASAENQPVFPLGSVRSSQDALHSSVWAKEYRDHFLALSNTTSILLANFTPEEIDQMICATLGVTEVAPEISQLVQDFSGGSYFWVREILQFIKEHGAEQFMSAIGETGAMSPMSPAAHVQGGSNHQILERKAKPIPSIKSPVMLRERSPSMSRSPSIRQMDRAPSLRAPSLDRGPNTPHQVHLDKLVLTRFGNLSSDVQRILRTASIIGVTFSAEVLYGVLPPRLQDQLNEAYQTLFNQRWLYQDAENESLYQFAHPHAYRIIYELIPSAERNHTHQLIATYLEANTDGAMQYGVLSFHYQHCDPDKALQYAVKATDTLLNGEFLFEMSDCVDLLTGCVPCCKSTYDIEVLLKLIDQARAAVRRFSTGPALFNARSSWFQRLGSTVSALVSLGPKTPTAKPGSVYITTDNEENDDVTDSGSPKNQRELESFAYDKRTKRLLLQQLSRLYDQLHENLQKMRSVGTPQVAHEWQVKLLQMDMPEAAAAECAPTQ